MIFIDSNIPMYLVGGEHPNKPVARRVLRAAIADGEILVTDAEVLQEILHRYATSDRHHLIGQAMSAVLDVVDEVFPMERADVDGAWGIIRATGLSARDAIHLAVMRRRGIDRIMSFDRGFDDVPGIVRISG